jgi:drug/metabolite transporter (DMT)-like permease
MAMSHRSAVLTMIAVTLMWSIAGVVSRHFEAARGFEVTFWRSLFNGLALTVMLAWLRGPATLIAAVRGGGRTLWLSSLCWAVMYTAFMMALALTTVANVLVTMALGPLFTALMARFALGHRLATRTWAAIVTAGMGIAWMYARELSASDARHLLGMLVALGVPVAAAVNWTLIQHNRSSAQQDLLPAVLIGALLSALATLAPALPLQATARDLGLLALLGTVQLAIPCLLAVTSARALSAPEISLLGLLEVVFGVLWAWLGANETPAGSVLTGGLLVLGALAGNELMAMRQRRS